MSESRKGFAKVTAIIIVFFIIAVVVGSIAVWTYLLKTPTSNKEFLLKTQMETE